jgi:Domain of unknown function (DUF4833)
MTLRKILVSACFVFMAGAAFAQRPGFPVPQANPLQLFYLQRTPNTNTIVCDLNLVNGKPDEEEPVHVYWIRYTEQGQKKELNYIQRKFAYGIKSKKLAEDRYELNFVSYKKLKMYLQMGPDRQYHVYAGINGKMAVLNRVFIQINGGTFWSPNVEYFEMAGTDPATRQPVMERKKI